MRLALLLPLGLGLLAASAFGQFAAGALDRHDPGEFARTTGGLVGQVVRCNPDIVVVELVPRAVRKIMDGSPDHATAAAALAVFKAAMADGTAPGAMPSSCDTARQSLRTLVEELDAAGH